MRNRYRFFRDKIVYISGATSGIGYACAELMVGRAAKIVMMARTRDRLRKAQRVLAARAGNTGTEIHILPLDVCDRQEVSRAIGTACREIGAPQVVIHSAGYAFPHAFSSINEQKLMEIFNTNFFGTWNMMQAILPTLSRGAVVVNVSSFTALLTFFGYSAYGASKYGVLGLSEALRNEYCPRGITIKVLCPSDTDTPQLTYENRYKPKETAAISGKVKPYSAQYVARYTLWRCCRRTPFLIIPGIYPKFIWLLKRLFPALLYRVIDGTLLRHYQK